MGLENFKSHEIWHDGSFHVLLLWSLNTAKWLQSTAYKLMHYISVSLVISQDIQQSLSEPQPKSKRQLKSLGGTKQKAVSFCFQVRHPQQALNVHFSGAKLTISVLS